MKKIINIILLAATAVGRILPKPNGMLWLTWTDNQAFDAPNITGNDTIAAGNAALRNADAGVLTITGLTAAPGAFDTAIITNNRVAAGDRILATLNNYTGVVGADGLPVLIDARFNGTGITFNIINNDGLNPLNGDVVISWHVGKPVI